MLGEIKGDIPNYYIEAMKDIKQRDAIISEKQAILLDKDAVNSYLAA